MPLINRNGIIFGRSGHVPYVEELETFFDAVLGWLRHT
jgi:hypothetical protein